MGKGAWLAISGSSAPTTSDQPHLPRWSDNALCIDDLSREGAALREIADVLLDPFPADWRVSSERSDLRRLADSAARMAAGDYSPNVRLVVIMTEVRSWSLLMRWKPAHPFHDAASRRHFDLVNAF